MIYPRRLQKEISKYLKDPEVIIITGMRRVGKTTLCQSIMDKIKSKNKIYLDLENPIQQKIFEENNYDNIINNLQEYGLDPNKPAYIFLDEIQTMPEIPKIIKYLFDHYHYKFILTGSSSYYLKNLFSESLSGRKFVFNLRPLDFEEFLIFKNIKSKIPLTWREKDKKKNLIRYNLLKPFYEEYLQYGGFPQVVLEKSREKKEKRLQDILKSYIEQDVRNLAKFKEIKNFRDLILLLTSRVGSKIDITRLSSELSVSRETIYSYLAFLENTFFIYLVGPYTKSKDKAVSKSHKVYFCDNGLLNIQKQISSGALLENAVFTCLLKYGEISYFQKFNGSEIDFISQNKIGLEVKNTGIIQDQKRLIKIADHIKIKESYVVSNNFSDADGLIIASDI